MLTNFTLEMSLELYSHADKTVLEAGALIIQNYNGLVDVVGTMHSKVCRCLKWSATSLHSTIQETGKYTILCSTRQSACHNLTITCFAQYNAV
jgi:hypothetical protein